MATLEDFLNIGTLITIWSVIYEFFKMILERKKNIQLNYLDKLIEKVEKEYEKEAENMVYRFVIKTLYNISFKIVRKPLFRKEKLFYSSVGNIFTQIFNDDDKKTYLKEGFKKDIELMNKLLFVNSEKRGKNKTV